MKALRSVSKQGHLQPHCHSKARSLSKQLYDGLFSHSDILLSNVQFCNSSFPRAQNYSFSNLWRHSLTHFAQHGMNREI